MCITNNSNSSNIISNISIIDKTKNYIQQKWNSKYISGNLDKITLKEEKESKKESNKESKKESEKENLAQEAHEAIRPTDIMKEMVENPKLVNM